MATRNQSDTIRQELNGTWQQISGAFNFSYTSIAGFPRLLLHYDGSLYVLADTGAILWLKPEYQIDGGAWTDSGWGPDGGKFTFPAGLDGTIPLQCNRPCFQAAYPAGTVINTRVMAKCSGSVVLCDSLLDPYPDVSKTWTQSESHTWNDAEDDVVLPLWGPFPDTGQTFSTNTGDDGDYGYDADENDDTDGLAGFSYTKLDASGAELLPDAASWEFTRDNRSGLIYKYNGLVYQTWDSAIADAAAYSGLGKSWRIPTIRELVFLANYWKGSGVIDPMVASLSSGFPFSSTEYATNTSNVWTLSLTDGHTDKAINKDAFDRPQFFVTGTELVPDFVDNGDGTVSDNSTGLMWSQTALGAADWYNSLTAANNLSLAGYDDWRMPNIKELHTIIDFSKADGDTAFPDIFNIPTGAIWTSTSKYSATANAWAIVCDEGTGGRGFMPLSFDKTTTWVANMVVRVGV